MEHTLLPFVKGLLKGTRLTDEEQRATLALGGILERVKAGRTFVPLGENTVSICLILEGLCARIELLTLGRRQITAFYIRGDMPDLYTAFNPRATSAIETITPAAIIRLPHAAIHKLIRTYPAIGEAFTRCLLTDAAISNKWIANVGGRDAKAAIAHLFCEMAVRYDQVQGNDFSFQFPVTQIQIGQAVGLSAVHVNRTYMTLRNANILLMDNSWVRVLNWNALQKVANFEGDYLVSDGQQRLVA